MPEPKSPRNPDRQDFYEKYMAMLDQVRDAYISQPITQDRITHAAPGLALALFRNAATVEYKLHVGSVVWGQADMLRKSALATKFCLDALPAIAKENNDVELSPNEMKRRLADLIDRMSMLIPESHANLRPEYIAETLDAADDWVEMYRRWGLDFWLAYITSRQETTWWCSAGWPELVAAYLDLTDTPPEPETFEERMLNAPWELTDEQASFATRNRHRAEKLIPEWRPDSGA